MTPAEAAAADLSEAALVERAQAGDFSAFEALAARHERRLYATALRIVRRPEDAEDVVQTALLSALEGLAGLRERAAFGAWLARTATRAAFKVLRRRRGPGGAALLQAGTGATGGCPPGEDCGDEGAAPPRPEFIAGWRDDPTSLVERREVRRLLDEAADALPEGQRLVFLARDVGGLSTEETAALLGIGAANVKVRLMRARLALRERLTRALGDPARAVAPHAHGEGGAHVHEPPARAAGEGGGP